MPRRSELLQELTGLIGFSETIELLGGWGGRRLTIPQKLEDTHPIALKIGPSKARLLAYYYGGTALDLPAERNAMIELRNNCIIRDLNADEPVRLVALKYGITARQVRNIRQNHGGHGGTCGRRWTDSGNITPST